VLGAGFLWGTIDLGRNPTPQRSMRVFGYSITYVTLLFAAMTIDVFVTPVPDDFHSGRAPADSVGRSTSFHSICQLRALRVARPTLKRVRRL
jgi:hypothetical protein